MLHAPARLETALAPLVGLPLWRSHRTLDLQVFQFGDRRTVIPDAGPRKGQAYEVGEYALHVQCAWRVHGPHGILVGSKDRYYRPGPDPRADLDDDWDWSTPGANRCDERISEWLQTSYVVVRVGADATGGVTIALAGGFFLDVFPDSSLDDEYSELWRLLRPAERTSHFVVSGGGIDPP